MPNGRRKKLRIPGRLGQGLRRVFGRKRLRLTSRAVRAFLRGPSKAKARQRLVKPRDRKPIKPRVRRRGRYGK